MTPYGQFPPTCIEDIMIYDGDEVVAGYRERRRDDIPPGENRSPGYRWGWTNSQRDHGQPDGFEPLRYAYIRAMRAAA